MHAWPTVAHPHLLPQPAELDPTVCQLFNVQSGGAYELGLPDAAQRSTFFTAISEVGWVGAA